MSSYKTSSNIDNKYLIDTKYVISLPVYKIMKNKLAWLFFSYIYSGLKRGDNKVSYGTLIVR